MMWHKKLYLIDHGASLFFHHQWATADEKYASPFPAIKDHVLLRFADDVPGDTIPNSKETLRSMLNSEVIKNIVANVPDEWLEVEAPFADREAIREAYVSFLTRRLEASHIFEQEAIRARAKLI
jgi:hypothetical protein